MPIYQYRCPENPKHYEEHWFRFGEYPQNIVCRSCESNWIEENYDACVAHYATNPDAPLGHPQVQMYRIIGETHFTVDTVDRQDFTQMTGVAHPFSNKQERDAWLKSQDRWIPSADDPGLKQAVDAQRANEELYHEVTSRGESWEEYVRDEADRKKREQDEELASMGVKITATTHGLDPAAMEEILERQMRGIPVPTDLLAPPSDVREKMQRADQDPFNRRFDAFRDRLQANAYDHEKNEELTRMDELFPMPPLRGMGPDLEQGRMKEDLTALLPQLPPIDSLGPDADNFDLREAVA